LYKKSNHNKGLGLSWLPCFLIAAAGLALVLMGGALNAGVHAGNGPIGIIYKVTNLSIRTFVFLFALWVLHMFLSIVKAPKKAAIISLSIWFSFNLVLFIAQQSPSNREHLRPGYTQVRFVGEAIKKDLSKSGELLKDKQLYWPAGPELIWFDLQSNSYYSFSQLAGAVFKKETIIEGSRRAMLAKPFEIARMRESKIPLKEGEWTRLSFFLKAAMHEPAPTKEDLIRLANDIKLDWIVLNIGFEGLYGAANGAVYIYDCARIRQMNSMLTGSK
jgi:hypothetical protein